MTDFDDVSVLINKINFNFRVAAMFEYEDQILLHTPSCDDFWKLTTSFKNILRFLFNELQWKREQ